MPVAHLTWARVGVRESLVIYQQLLWADRNAHCSSLNAPRGCAWICAHVTGHLWHSRIDTEGGLEFTRMRYYLWLGWVQLECLRFALKKSEEMNMKLASCLVLLLVWSARTVSWTGLRLRCEGFGLLSYGKVVTQAVYMSSLSVESSLKPFIWAAFSCVLAVSTTVTIC